MPTNNNGAPPPRDPKKKEATSPPPPKKKPWSIYGPYDDFESMARGEIKRLMDRDL